MIDGLKPYPAYQDVASPWIGRFPSHWKVRRAKSFLREVDERSVTGDEELLSVSHKTGVTPRREKNVTMFLAESNVGHKVCRPADIVVNTMWAWMAAVGVSRGTGIVSPSYAVYRPRRARTFEPRYLDALLRTPQYRSEYVSRSKGITTSRLRLYPDAFLAIPLPCPDASEQAAIVRFLDHADRRVRRYIRVKQQLIKLLEEQKQVIIHQAVTRGLDPNVRLKPSGVEWLGDVPAHWQTARCKHLFAEVDLRSPSGSEQHLSMSQRLGLVPSEQVENRTLVSESYAGGKLCRPGDLVLNRLKAHLGVFAVSRDDGVISPDYTVLRPTGALPVEFFESLLRSQACRGELRRRVKGIVEGFWRLYTDDFYTITLPVPPLNERAEIVTRLEASTAAIRTTISTTEHEIALLHEFHTRLVADVVTGQLDVREAAARLPEIPTESATDDATDDLDDEASDDTDSDDVEEDAA